MPILLLLMTCAFGAPAWHHPLYLGNGGYWRARLPVTVTNLSGEDVAGGVAALDIPGNGGPLLAGAAEDAIRVCDSLGREMLYRVADNRLYFAAECRAKSSAAYYIYYDNPEAWKVPDFLKDAPADARLSVKAGEVEKITLKEGGEGAGKGPRVPVRVFNFSEKPLINALVVSDLEEALNRLRIHPLRTGLIVSQGENAVRHWLLDTKLVFHASVGKKSVNTFWVGLRPRESAGRRAGLEIIESRGNLVRNPSFEDNLSGWDSSGTGNALEDSGLFGKYSAKIMLPEKDSLPWTGFRQKIRVRPGAVYLYSVFATGTDRVYGHYLDKDGNLCRNDPFTEARAGERQDGGWFAMAGLFRMPEDAAFFEAHLTRNRPGTARFDGALLAEAVLGQAGPVRFPAGRETRKLAAWPVNPVVKVFQDDAPPGEVPVARISMARNEKEPLQLALRSPADLKGLRIEADAPFQARGTELSPPEIAVEGYVRVDHPSGYYTDNGPAWRRKYPALQGGSDGWAGLWPDPLYPHCGLDLEAGKTRPVWITFSAGKEAGPGDYTGVIRIMKEGKPLLKVPFEVHVWDFSLPDTAGLIAVFDVHDNPAFKGGREALWRLMAEHRVSPNWTTPFPEIRGDGKIDFTEHDRAAALYFDTLHFLNNYAPGYFYQFCWGNPVNNSLGNRYPALLKSYWDHMKAKGWQDRTVLYIADEPQFHKPGIIEQMEAACGRVRAADTSIPVYSSTWYYVPRWEKSVSIWGIGHYGTVPADTMKALRKRGRRLRFTLDGQFCLDTPLCGLERLIPYFCFKYGVEGYEFWGINWTTYDPFEFGWHAYGHQTYAPGDASWSRFPNGDGYFVYPGKEGPLSSIRLEQIREGLEDYEYLRILKARLPGTERALQRALDLVSIPCAEGRYSTRFLKDPDEIYRAREQMARAIEALKP